MAVQVYNLVAEREYFGKLDDQLLEKFRIELNELFSQATLFKTREEQEAELATCIQNLSITTTANVDIADKLNSVSMKSND